MPLPKIATPTYELELPSTGQTIQYRPFLVKEEKVLVIALESEDNKQITKIYICSVYCRFNFRISRGISSITRRLQTK